MEMSRGRSLLLFVLAGSVLIYVLLSPQTARPVQSVALHTAPVVRMFPLGDVRGGPSLTAAFIDRVLALAGSPAQGLGAILYQLSEQYQIDDAVALAFFHHESDYGRYGVAAVTHNFGNLRCAGYRPCTADDFRVYPSWAAGAGDWYHLLASVYVAQGLVTVQQIVPVYAPAVDGNDERAYMQAVLNDLRSWQEARR
jgi:hypothetical protein